MHLIITADRKRTEFASLHFTLSITFHSIKRGDIFNSVNHLLTKKGVLSEYPLRIKFDGEVGFDSGGVCRDMFSAYWEEAFKNFLMETQS